MNPFSDQEKEEIRLLFGKDLQDLDSPTLADIHKDLRQKYHPDKFEQYEDEVVKEMAKEKFQRIEHLAAKIQSYLTDLPTPPAEADAELYHESARFAYEMMKIELITREKDLKYHLFGSRLRWLERGDKFKIPRTQASLIMDNDHRGVSIGFTESVRMFLTFGPEDSLEDISQWLYDKIKGYAQALLIEGTRIPVELQAMQTHIRRKSFLGLGPRQ